MKIKGLRTLPCGIPLLEGFQLDRESSTFTHCCLWVSQWVINSRFLPWIPICLILSKAMKKSILSYALEKSRNMISQLAPSLIMSRTVSIWFMSWVIALLPFCDPCWVSSYTEWGNVAFFIWIKARQGIETHKWFQGEARQGNIID